MTLTGTYDPTLVTLSVLVGVVASYTALDLSVRVGAAQGWPRRAWLAAAGFAAGGGIWSMHFVGMLAFRLPMPVRFRFDLTLVSLAVPVLLTAIGLAVAMRPGRGRAGVAAGGLLLGAGIAAMHYLGMAAMEMEGGVRYDPGLVVLSVAIAIGAASAALHIARRRRTPRETILASLALGIAISGMHYTAMAAADFGAVPAMPGPHHAGLQPGMVSTAVLAVTLSMLLLALVAAHLDQWRVERRTERRLADIAANFAGVIYRRVLHPDGRLSYPYVSEGVRSLMGDAFDAAAPAAIDEVAFGAVLEEDRGRWIEAIRASAAEMRPYTVEGRVRHRDGSIRWVRSAAYPHRDADGSIVWDGVLFDVTDLREAENARRLGEERLTLATEAAGLGSWDWDLETGRFTVSPRARVLLEVEETEEPPWTRLDRYVHSEDRDAVRTAVEAALDPARRSEFDVEFRLLLPDGAVRWLSARGRTLFDRPGGGARALRFLGMLMDVTGRRQAEEMLRRSLAEKEMLLGEVHHRVRNNLQVVLSLIRLEEGRMDDDGAGRMKALAQRISVLGQLHEQLYRSGEFGRVDLPDYLGDLVRTLVEVHRGTREVEMRIDVEPMECDLDTALPLGLLANELVTNALKHAFPDGRPGRVAIALRRAGPEVVFEVADDGAGEAQALAAGGTGRKSLGRQLIHALARQLGGEPVRTDGPGTRIRVAIDAGRFSPRSLLEASRAAR
jgi:NO-binding membrane sensor protein with MHYT domain/two-component sensor histidine kinase